MGEEVITSPMEMAEAFNSYFTNVGVNLAAKIPSPKFTPESYLTPTDNIFSIEIPTTTTVCRLLKAIDENKSAGLDNIPNNLLKMAKKYSPFQKEYLYVKLSAAYSPFGPRSVIQRVRDHDRQEPKVFRKEPDGLRPQF